MYEKPSNGYTIYTKSQCPACVEVKKLLPEATIILCDQYLIEDVDEFLDFMWSLPKASGITSFPMVFKDGEYVGGYKEICFQTNVDF
jgi:glutaredoxin